MSLEKNVIEVLAPTLERAGYLVESVKITPAGKRSVVSVIVDHEDKNLTLDEVTEASKIVSGILDNYSQLGERSFTLEVTSPGIDRPLTVPRHWRKNLGRLVTITPFEGTARTGRIVSASDRGAIVDFNDIEESVPFESIKRAQIQIEFNRKEKR